MRTDSVFKRLPTIMVLVENSSKPAFHGMGQRQPHLRGANDQSILFIERNPVQREAISSHERNSEPTNHPCQEVFLIGGPLQDFV